MDPMSVLRWVKSRARRMMGRELSLREDVSCPTERLGTEYGGWVICPDGLNAQSIVYSFGLGEDVSFDLAMIQRFGFAIHGFDPTPRSLEWLQQQSLPATFHIHPYGLAAKDRILEFSMPEDPSHVSLTAVPTSPTRRKLSLPVKRLSTIMAELGHDRIDLLKMDIEGCEYEVIDDLAAGSIRPGQILIEFHHRFPSVGVKRTAEAVKTLRGIGYELFHNHNLGEELSFIRKAGRASTER